MLEGASLRLVRLVHVGSAGIWLGALTAIVALHAWEAFAPASARFGLTLAAYRLHESVLFWAFIVTMTTALGFSLFSAWGFAQHRWIVAKWALASLLFGATLWLQSPALSGAVALADAGGPMKLRP